MTEVLSIASQPWLWNVITVGDLLRWQGRTVRVLAVDQLRGQVTVEELGGPGAGRGVHPGSAERGGMSARKETDDEG